MQLSFRSMVLQNRQVLLCVSIPGPLESDVLTAPTDDWGALAAADRRHSKIEVMPLPSRRMCYSQDEDLRKGTMYTWHRFGFDRCFVLCCDKILQLATHVRQHALTKPCHALRRMCKAHATRVHACRTTSLNCNATEQ